MRSNNIKYITSLTLAAVCIFPTCASALSYNNFISSPSISCTADINSSGTGIFSEENMQYLSEEEKKQLKEIQTLKDKGIKLSDAQVQQLQCIVTTVVRSKLGDEKFKDFNVLMEKKNNNVDLTLEEKERLKEYKKTLHNCEDCSNNEVFKQFFR